MMWKMEQFTQNDVENGTVHIDRCGTFSLMNLVKVEIALNIKLLLSHDNR